MQKKERAQKEEVERKKTAEKERERRRKRFCESKTILREVRKV